ncbi:MAG: MerR family transcriptional regulator [Bacteroidales bacterium]|nr:MerR family transcriptional regulator [Bacteroidales bacterium]
MDKKICYTIGEVAGILGENVSLVRFWSNKFTDFVHPQRNAKGNRLYSPQDVEFFKKIHYYVKDRGMTLEGVEKLLKDNSAGSDNRAEVVERLRAIKALLQEVKESI